MGYNRLQRMTFFRDRAARIFRLELQRKRLQSTATCCIVGGIGPRERDEMSSGPKRVLIVDDDAAIIEVVECALRDRGYEVLIARDGEEALKRAERDAPDLILLDLVMPKRSGLTVLERLKRDRPGTPPIIMLTARDEERHRAFAKSLGVSAYLNKPFDIDTLMQTVEELIS